MKALVYTGPETLELREVADAVARDDEVLVDIAACGICGSDMHAFLGHDDRRPAPLILGHEVVGRVRSDGRRVAVNPLVTCGACRFCRAGRDNLCETRQIISMAPREGGFAQTVAIPPRNLVDLPDGLSDAQAALAEPVACGWHAARIALAHCGRGDLPALAIGGGAIGLGAALALIAQGKSDVVLIEPGAARRDYIARTCGIDVRAPDAVSGPFDVVIDGVGFPTTRAQASAQIRPGGIIVHIGLGSADGGLDIRRMTLQEIAFAGSYTYTAQDFRHTVAAMADGRLGALDWTETRPLGDGARAFGDIRTGGIAAPKVLLEP